MPRFRVCSATLLLLSCVAQAAEPDVQHWRFTVRLAERNIGEHVFERHDSPSGHRVSSRAHFKVDWLHIPLLRYHHQAEERWQDGCLVGIDATTRSNGRSETVRGQRTPAGFSLEAPAATTLDAPCVMTFAYWDRRIVEQKRLLNAQTGAYMPVSVHFLGYESIPVAGKPRPAEHFLLEAQDLRIELWYAEDGQWLGLAAPLRDGRRMTYRLEG